MQLCPNTNPVWFMSETNWPSPRKGQWEQIQLSHILNQIPLRSPSFQNSTFTCPVNSVLRVTSTLNPVVPRRQNKTAHFFLSAIIFFGGWWGGAHVPGWYQTHYVKMTLNFLSSCLQLFHTWLNMVLRIELGASFMPSKCFVLWATYPAP